MDPEFIMDSEFIKVEKYIEPIGHRYSDPYTFKLDTFINKYEIHQISCDKDICRLYHRNSNKIFLLEKEKVIKHFNLKKIEM
jgi:hypothetical protein